MAFVYTFIHAAYVELKQNSLMTQTPPKPKFIVVYGAPRTGTSLCMDIVQAAGYNPGRCYIPPQNPRRGRHEHRLFGQPLRNWKPGAWKIIEDENITCAKVVAYPEWINFLRQRFTVSIVAPIRDRETRNKSAADMLVHIDGYKNKIDAQENLLAKRWAFLNVKKFDGDVAKVRFEYLIMKDPNVFEYLREFLEYDGPTEDLMRPVDVGRVKFND